MLGFRLVPEGFTVVPKEDAEFLEAARTIRHLSGGLADHHDVKDFDEALDEGLKSIASGKRTEDAESTIGLLRTETLPSSTDAPVSMNVCHNTRQDPDLEQSIANMKLLGSVFGFVFGAVPLSLPAGELPQGGRETAAIITLAGVVAAVSGIKQYRRATRQLR
jgi:hypothetical protein